MARSNLSLPLVSGDFLGLVLVLCVGGPSLILNNPLVEDDSNDNKALGK